MLKAKKRLYVGFLCHMDQKQAIRIAKRFAEAVRPYWPVCGILLYGSDAKDSARRYSDIDVVAVVDEYAGDVLGISPYRANK